ncbi:glyoxalase [Sedimenticola selenatireducens]|uniref:Glyoxalase n=1 Tax=Sedimenticola selenatireducens TaxID=191960 RepID=A0A558DKU0_9GAMM|nr:glyoxalase [Sedimenticola selenatireducens]TVO74103.1 glyoxalase [Sedimenticola selenatireducens]TVT61623.1 MAG: glyoxalase [Sedimenticola selenatireducens]
MTTEDHPFMNYRALFIGAIILAVLSLVMMALAVLFEIDKATAPQLLTLSALWIAPGIYTALQARDGRLLHGMVMGVLGALLVALLINQARSIFPTSGILQQLAGDKVVVVIILGGLWGAIGGIFAEIVHLRRVKKANKQRK